MTITPYTFFRSILDYLREHYLILDWECYPSCILVHFLDSSDLAENDRVYLKNAYDLNIHSTGNWVSISKKASDIDG